MEIRILLLSVSMDCDYPECKQIENFCIKNCFLLFVIIISDATIADDAVLVDTSERYDGF